MLRTIHKNKKSIVVFLVAGTAALVMTGFGLGFLNSPAVNMRAAITIDDTEISPQELERRRAELENQYRRIFNKDYEKLTRDLGINIRQETVDRVIQETLIVKEASTLR